MNAMLLSCPNCRAALRLTGPVPEGKRPRCPKCGAIVPLSEVASGDADTKPAERVSENALGDSGIARAIADSVKFAGDSAKHVVPPSYAFLTPPKAPGELGRLGKYRVLSELGIGGMGMVFRAEDTMLKRHVALKVMLPKYAVNESAKQRFLREARVAAQVENDHVVPIFNVDEDNDTPYLAMPLLKGETLADFLRRVPLVPWPEVVRVGREMAEGLAAAHEKHLIHRDIKPGNVWLEGERRRVKILDFGLARPEKGYEDESFSHSGLSEESSSGENGNQLTRTGMIIGTPAYMSPEQARGRKVDARTDLFSLGVVLYQMLTGRVPFNGPNTMALLTALAVDNPTPPSELVADVPPELNALVLQLLAKDAEQRPASAAAVAKFLGEFEAATRALTGGSFPTPMPEHNPWSQIESAWGAAETMTPDDPTPQPRPVVKLRPRAARRLVPWIAAAALGVGTLGLLAVFAAVITASARGTLIVECEDADVLLTIKKDGHTVVERTQERSMRLDAGTYTLELPEHKDLWRLSQNIVVIPAKGEETVQIRKREAPKPSPPVKPPIATTKSPAPTTKAPGSSPTRRKPNPP